MNKHRFAAGPHPNPVDPGNVPPPKPHEIPVERRPDEEPPGVTEPSTVPKDPPQELPGGEPVSPVRMGQIIAVAVMAALAMAIEPTARQTGAVQAQVAPTPPTRGLEPDGSIPPAPPEGGIEGGTDRNNPATGGDTTGETLTDRLNRTDGVLRPPPVGDPDIRMKPPEGGTLRVIPPPTNPPVRPPQQ